MHIGVLFALLAYGLFSCADATIKSLSGELGIFEIGFFTALFATIPAILSKGKDTRWNVAVRFENPVLLNLRGISGVLGSACVIYAFTNVPLAEVYSLAFMAPLFVAALSAVLLKEAVPSHRWTLLVVSFVGVLIVVRPGFRELQLGHLAALACAFFTAANTIILRSLAPREHRLSIFTVVTLYATAGNGAAMLISGANMPNLEQLGILAFIGTLGGIGHLTFIAATRLAPANQVAPAQYTQMVWALTLGAIFYSEYVDAVGIAGLIILVTAGVLNALPGQASALLRAGNPPQQAQNEA